MSYTRYRGRARGLGDATAAIEQQAQLDCINKANASPQVVAIDGVIENLARTWKPTGYYRPAEVRQLLDTLATEAAAAGAALAAAPLSTNDALTVKRMAFDDLGTKYQDRARAYERALAAAASAGSNVIDAPALKDWVISSMRAISDAYVTATVLHCRQSWLESWLDRGYRAMAAIGSVASRIVGVAVAAGELVIKAADKAIDVAAMLVKFGPLVAVGLGGYLLYGMYKKRRRS